MQIKQLSLGIFLMLGIGLCSIDNLHAQLGGGPSPVVVSRVIATDQMSSKTFVGSLVPLRRSTIGSAVDGRVTQMFVEEGDAVSVDSTKLVNGSPLGQPLVQLRTVLLEIEIEAATVELRIRQQAEEELQRTLPTEIKGAQSAVAEIKARLKFSKANNERMQSLFESGGGVSQQEVDEAYSTYLSQTQLNIGVKTLLKKLTATRESRLRQSQHKVEAQESELRRLQELKNDYTIRAPFPGYVTSKNTELGQWVARGETVLEIIQLDPIELVIPVPQTYIQALHVSLEEARKNNTRLVASISVDSLPNLLEGEVVQAVPQADLRSRSFPVKIRIKNPKGPSGHLLKSGMLARATMFLGKKDRILMVKKDALVLGGLQKGLYVVSTDSETKSSAAKLVPVNVGASNGDWIQVTGDIMAGDQVVVVGNERLQPGQPIMVSSELEDRPPTLKQPTSVESD